MRRFVLLLSLLIAFDGWAETPPGEDAKLYHDGKNGFEFSFPAVLTFETAFGAGELKEIATGKTVFVTEVWPPDECSHAPGEEKVVPVTDLAVRRSKVLCQADGVDGSSYCTDPVQIRPFQSQNGAKGFELFLARVSERCDEQNSCTSTIHGKKGPLFAIDISNPRVTKILYVEPAGVDPLREKTGMEAAPEVTRSILSTLSVFEGGPAPSGVCIQDLPRNRGLSLPSVEHE